VFTSTALELRIYYIYHIYQTVSHIAGRLNANVAPSHRDYFQPIFYHHEPLLFSEILTLMGQIY
jgi:hypothetical protein